MITQTQLKDAFDAIGIMVELTPAGLDFRVEPDQPGAKVLVRNSPVGPYVEVQVNYTRVVDLRVAEVDEDKRQLVLVAEDWGRSLDAPPLVFRVGVAEDGLFVSDLSDDDAGPAEL